MPRFLCIGNRAINLDLVTNVDYEPNGTTVDEETGECSPAATVHQLGDFLRLRLTGREAQQLWAHVTGAPTAPRFGHYSGPLERIGADSLTEITLGNH
jgi:hypothetical protein